MRRPTAIFPDCTADLATFLTPELRGIVPELEIAMDDGDVAVMIDRLRLHPACLLISFHVSAEVLRACPKLQAIVYLSTGVAGHVDMAAATARGIRTRHVPGYGNRAVAEHSLALMFAAARRIASMDRDLRAGFWRQLRGSELAGRVVGIVGLGAIGQATATLAEAVGLKVIAYSRNTQAGNGRWPVLPLDELLGMADVVSLHLLHTAETDRIIDRRRLALMKPNAILINTARGRLIDEDALIDALRQGRLAHAALDVFAQEPLPPGHPLTALDNVTLTTHSAWYTAEATHRLLRGGLLALREELDRLARES